MRLDLYISNEIIEPTLFLDLILRAKNTTVLDCYFYDEDKLTVDITGATVFFTVKEKSTDTDENAKLKKTITSLTSPTGGNTEIEITPTDSANLLNNYLYSIKIKLSTGKIYTVAEGNVCFRREITIRTT